MCMAVQVSAYSHDRASTSRSGVTGLLQDVFTCEAPMTPAEVAHLVKAEEVQRCFKSTSSTYRLPKKHHDGDTYQQIEDQSRQSL